MQTKTTPANINSNILLDLYTVISKKLGMDEHKKLCHGKMNTENFATLLGDCFKSALL